MLGRLKEALRFFWVFLFAFCSHNPVLRNDRKLLRSSSVFISTSQPWLYRCKVLCVFFFWEICQRNHFRCSIYQWCKQISINLIIMSIMFNWKWHCMETESRPLKHRMMSKFQRTAVHLDEFCGIFYPQWIYADSTASPNTRVFPWWIPAGEPIWSAQKVHLSDPNATPSICFGKIWLKFNKTKFYDSPCLPFS